jgi:hypothetical protein
LRRDIPFLHGLQQLNENQHGKVPACSSVYILLYEKCPVFVLEKCFKDIGGFKEFFIWNSKFQMQNLHAAPWQIFSLLAAKAGWTDF